jgi:hypothetical protein
MIINLQNKTILRAFKPKSQGSYLKINKSGRGITTALINHKERYIKETTEITKQSKKTIPLLLTKPIYPHDEVNKLAEQWCQLVINQIQEEHSYACHYT